MVLTCYCVTILRCGPVQGTALSLRRVGGTGSFYYWVTYCV